MTDAATARFDAVPRKREGIRSDDGVEPPHDHPVDDRARRSADFTACVVDEGTG